MPIQGEYVFEVRVVYLQVATLADESVVGGETSSFGDRCINRGRRRFVDT